MICVGWVGGVLVVAHVQQRTNRFRNARCQQTCCLPIFANLQTKYWLFNYLVLEILKWFAWGGWGVFWLLRMYNRAQTDFETRVAKKHIVCQHLQICKKYWIFNNLVLGWMHHHFANLQILANNMFFCNARFEICLCAVVHAQQPEHPPPTPRKSF